MEGYKPEGIRVYDYEKRKDGIDLLRCSEEDGDCDAAVSAVSVSVVNMG